MSESNDDGVQGVWYGDVSADTIGDIETNKWSGVEDIVKGYNDLKAQGSDFKVPDGSNSDEMSDFYDKLGRPETPDDYDFDIGAHDQEGSYNAFRESAHKHGLTDAQAEGMYKDGDALAKEYRAGMEASIKEQNEKTIGDLKQEWGKDYDNRMEDARKAFKDMGLEEDVAEEVGKLLGVGNTVKLFDALANGSKEHQFLDDGGATGTTKQAIKDEIYEITHRPEYMDDTKNKLLFNRVTKLYEQLVPG
jgi:hypothetical protein